MSLSHNPDLNDAFYLSLIQIDVKFLFMMTYNAYYLHYVTPTSGKVQNLALNKQQLETTYSQLLTG